LRSARRVRDIGTSKETEIAEAKKSLTNRQSRAEESASSETRDIPLGELTEERAVARG